MTTPAGLPRRFLTNTGRLLRCNIWENHRERTVSYVGECHAVWQSLCAVWQRADTKEQPVHQRVVQLVVPCSRCSVLADFPKCCHAEFGIHLGQAGEMLQWLSENGVWILSNQLQD